MTFAVTQGGYVLELIHTEVECDDNTCKSPLTHFTVLPPHKQIMKNMQPILTWGHSWGRAVVEKRTVPRGKFANYTERDRSWSHSVGQLLAFIVMTLWVGLQWA